MSLLRSCTPSEAEECTPGEAEECTPSEAEECTPSGADMCTPSAAEGWWYAPTCVLVSASLDEQCMSQSEICTPSGAEGCFTFQGFALLFADISPLQDNSDSILPRVAKIYLHDEILWYARAHG